MGWNWPTVDDKTKKVIVKALTGAVIVFLTTIQNGGLTLSVVEAAIIVGLLAFFNDVQPATGAGAPEPGTGWKSWLKHVGV
jgi:hypothetical protein